MSHSIKGPVEGQSPSEHLVGTVQSKRSEVQLIEAPHTLLSYEPEHGCDCSSERSLGW